MKRFLSCLCTLTVIALLLAGCGTAEVTSDPSEEQAAVRIGGLTGPTAIGMVRIMALSEAGQQGLEIAETITSPDSSIFGLLQIMDTPVTAPQGPVYDISLAGSADVLTPKLLQGELDLAAIPANLAAVLSQKAEMDIQVLAVNTLGVLYLVEAGGQTIHSIADLEGKTIYATGKGLPPEYTLRYLLSENGLDPDTDVSIEWRSEPAEVVSLLAQHGGIAMLPQPYVVAAQGQVEGLQIALDLTEAWDALDTGSTLITGVMVGRTAFIQEHPEAVAQFLADYEASIQYANEHVSETAALCETFDLFKEAVAEQAIPYCNITFLSGEDMKSALSGYLEVLYAQNPQAVGGAVPNDSFYYLS